MSRDDVRRYLIGYDISDDQRRASVASKLQAYGDRIQFSLFLIDARPARLLRLRYLLERAIDPVWDSIVICDLGLISLASDARIQFLGRRASITPHGPLIT